MSEHEAIELLLSSYTAPSVLAAWLTIKGFASVITNNFHTEEWKISPILDWLASTNKKAKFTGDYLADDKIDHAQKVNEPRSMALKFLSKFS